MELNEYQSAAATTAIYPSAGTGNPEAISYTIFGLLGESGEIANKWKKFFRDHDEFIPNDEWLEHYKHFLRDELGDALWYVANLAKELGIDLDTLASDNLDKLESRAERGALRGSGDHR